jgi:hypothetical protein
VAGSIVNFVIFEYCDLEAQGQLGFEMKEFGFKAKATDEGVVNRMTNMICTIIS